MTDRDRASFTVIIIAATRFFGVASADTRSSDDLSRSTSSDPIYQTAWHEFYFGGPGEDDVDAPLLRVGKPILPSLCRAVLDPSMRRRRYAIGALGWIKDRRGLLTLETTD